MSLLSVLCDPNLDDVASAALTVCFCRQQTDERERAALTDADVSVYDVGNVLKQEDAELEAKAKEEALRTFRDTTLQECFAKLIFSLKTPADIAAAVSSSLITRCVRAV